jgi:dipeptidyl aminopeptidase/acylaminoacyl peptidase
MDLIRLLLLYAPITFVSITPAEAQSGDTIGPGENLVVDGIPPISSDIADEVRRYTEFRSASLADWHPTRREMLISTRFGKTNQIHQVLMPGGARGQLTFYEEPVSSALYEPKRGRYFVFLRDVGGNEFTQIYRYDLGSGLVTLLTDGRSQNADVSWSKAGDRIAYGSTRRNGADRDIYIMNPLEHSSDRLLLRVEGGGWGVEDWSPDDRQLIATEFLSIDRSRLWLVDTRSGGRSPLIQEDSTETVAWANPRFSRDGRSVYLISDRGSEFSYLAVMDLATRALTRITTGIDWDVDQFEISADGRTIAFVVNEGGISKLHLLNTATRRFRPVAAIPLGPITGLTWHRERNELGITLATARAAGDVYSLDVAVGKLTRWTVSETGGLDTSALPDPETIRWTSFDDREITGFYYRPPRRFTGKRPVLISIHGGPESQARPGFLGRSNYFLIELGIAIIFPNVRGSTGYGKSFSKLDNGMKREDSVKDIGALLGWISRHPELDARKVMVTGGSYGGYMTLGTATNYNHLICCSLDVVGISNFVTFLTNTESYRRDLRRAEYGDERVPAMRAYMERIAPVNNAQRITKPLFVVQGGNDPRVPKTEADQMVATVKKNGTPVWYLLAKDEGHGFRKKPSIDFQFYATVRFIQQYLLNGPVRPPEGARASSP